MATGKERPRTAEHLGAVQAVAFSPDGRTLASVADDKTIRLWDATTGQPRLQLKQQLSLVSPCCAVWFTPDGKAVASASNDDTLSFWDVATGVEKHKLARVDGRIESFACSRDNKTMAVRVIAKELEPIRATIHVFDTATGKERRRFADPHQFGTGYWILPSYRSMALSPDGELLATKAGTRICLWDAASGKELRQLAGHTQPVSGIAFSPDGKTLASGGGGGWKWSLSNGGPEGAAEGIDQTIRLWDVASGRQLLTLKGHERAVASVTFSADGRMLISGGNDGTVRLWETATGKELLRFAVPHSHVFAVATSLDGKFLASGMSDGTALVWDLSPSGWKPPKEKLSAAELNAVWNELAGYDAPKAYRAVYTLSAAQMDVVAFVKERLQPVPKEKPERLQKLTAQLDDDDPAIREAATKQLAGIGAPAGPALRKALAETKSAEVKLRVENLLKPLDEWVVKDPETLRAIRAIWVLQRIGTKEARDLLEKLAAGAPEARITQEAQSALTILSRKPPPAKK